MRQVRKGVGFTTDKYIELIESGNFIDASSMRTGFFNENTDICEIFELVWELHDLDNWEDIDRYMGREYLCDWINFKASLGELTDRSLVFERERDFDLDDEDLPLDRTIRDLVGDLVEKNEICDLYDILYLCCSRYDDLGPDIKGLLQTFFIYFDERHMDYIITTQYDPDIDEDELRDLYRDMVGRLELKPLPLQA